ncbi:hypothetical protein R1sor_004073 [Riccia sorocarpa]|uniref:Uncharacterized protein n=1 Tax=Riccia sorocarpa TaxID=122646 RepID=A0ABD3H7G7_9MARC
MMEVATKRSDEPQAKLKRELKAKEQELKRLQENDKKIRHRLKAAKKKERDLETELKKMPVGVVMKGESKTLELMKSGKKWHISCYPQLFNASDYTQWKSPVLPVICLLGGELQGDDTISVDEGVLSGSGGGPQISEGEVLLFLGR